MCIRAPAWPNLATGEQSAILGQQPAWSALDLSAGVELNSYKVVPFITQRHGRGVVSSHGIRDARHRFAGRSQPTSSPASRRTVDLRFCSGVLSAPAGSADKRFQLRSGGSRIGVIAATAFGLTVVVLASGAFYSVRICGRGLCSRRHQAGPLVSLPLRFQITTRRSQSWPASYSSQPAEARLTAWDFLSCAEALLNKRTPSSCCSALGKRHLRIKILRASGKMRDQDVRL